LEITIHEGRTHQVKRMLETVGHLVLKLVRIKMGPLSLGDLAPGEFRYLEDREANALRELVEARRSAADPEGVPARPMPARSRTGWAKPKRSRVA
jgi:23S rRNA pseudouridine2605 synthase